MKKKIVITISCILCLLILLILTAYFEGWFSSASEQEKKYMTELNESNVVVYYYGSLNPGKEITINYKKVNEFTEASIGDPDNIYTYHVIVIFDFDGTMNLTNTELLLIKKYCEENYYDLLYYGSSHLEAFKECGYFSQMDTKSLGFTYNGSYWINRSDKDQYANPYLLLGLWEEDDNKSFDNNDSHIMWKMAISYISDLIKSSRGES